MLRLSRLLPLAVLVFVVVVPVLWVVFHERGIIARAGQAETDAYWGTHELVSNQSDVRFQRDSGAGRPYIYSDDGIQLLEYSEWGNSSWIYVRSASTDAGTETLFLHPHGYAFDDNLISHTIQGLGWQLVENISITGPRQVKIDYYFASSLPDLTEVQLSLSHYHWYFQQVNRGATGFDALVGKNLDRADLGQATIQEPARYKVKVTSMTPNNLAKVDPVLVGYQDSNGISNVVTHYDITGPLPRDVLTLIASEVVSWDGL